MRALAFEGINDHLTRVAFAVQDMWETGLKGSAIYALAEVGALYQRLEVYIQTGKETDMAIGYNRVDLIGNVGKDPQVSSGDKGTLRASFTLAVDRPPTNGNENRREEADWFSIVAWGRVAETCRDDLAKGSWVFISGQLRPRRWQDEKGYWHNITEVIAQQIIPLESEVQEEPVSQPV
jgi:single-strand DNA-binding protein